MEIKTMSEESKKFKQIRVSLKLTQVEMASKLLVKQATISDIERSRIGVSRKLRNKIKTLLNIDFDIDKTTQIVVNKTDWNFCPHCGNSLK